MHEYFIKYILPRSGIKGYEIIEANSGKEAVVEFNNKKNRPQRFSEKYIITNINKL